MDPAQAAPAPPLNNDVASAYGAYRDISGGAAADAEAARLFGGAPKPAGEPGPMAPATVPQAGGKPRGVAGTVGAVAKDYWEGVTSDQPRALYSGVTGALTQIPHMVHDLSDWVEKQAGVTPEPSKAETESLQSMDKLAHAAEPKTVTGGLLQGVYQFITGLAMTGGMSGEAQATGTAAKYAIAAGKGALANAAAFDPHQARLDNLIQEFPALRNPISAWMASKPGDSNALGRLKNGLEGLGLGLLTDGLVKSLRLMRAVFDAKSAARIGTPEAVAAGAQPGLEPGAFRGIGDETAPRGAPLVNVSRGTEVPLGAKFNTELQNDWEGAKARYAALNNPKVADTQGGRVLNVDMMRELSPEYVADRTRSAEVQDAASDAIKRLYTEELAKPAPAGRENSVLFTAGGSGAGKSTAIENVSQVKSLADKAQIIYDTNMSSVGSARAKIEEALNAGKKVDIAYIYRDPEEALRKGALPRAMGMGRTVPVDVLAENHGGAFRTVQKLMEEYQGNEDVHFHPIDNSFGKGQAKLSTMDAISGKRYNVPVQELRDAVEDEFRKGEISPQVREGTLRSVEPGAGETGPTTAQPGGIRPTAGVQPGAGPSAGGQPQPPNQGGGTLTPQQLAAAPSGPPQIQINFAHIDTPEDVHRALQELADVDAQQIKQAKRGVQTFPQIQANAAQEDAWRILSSRQTGQAFNAEQLRAGKELWVSSGARLEQASDLAMTQPTPENLFAFKKMLDTHNLIQQQFFGAQAEAGRALGILRAPVGSSADRLKQVQDLINAYGGTENLQLLASKVSALAKMPGAQGQLALAKMAQRSVGARTRDAILQAFTDGLLTSPVTQAKILASNVTTGLWRVVERYGAEKMSQVLGSENGVAPGEAAAMWSGWLGGFKDAMAYGWQAAKTGVTGAGLGEPHEQFPSFVNGHLFDTVRNGVIQNDHPWLSKAADFIGGALSAGRRGIAAQHDVALTMAYRGELNAQALRQATAEAADGTLHPDGVAARAAELVANPPDNILQVARDSARYQAFLNQPGPVAQWLLDGRQKIPALRIVAPFVKIGANIFNYTMERTPLALLQKRFWTNINAGGAQRDTALAQLALGNLILASSADMYLSGNAKGQGPPQKGVEQAEEREGMTRDSIKVGDTWMNINGIHPIGKLMLLGIDVAEAITGGQQELVKDENVEKVWAGTTLAIARTLVDSSYFTGFQNLFGVLHDARVGGAGETGLLSTAGGFEPTAIRAAARASDPYLREVYGLLDEFKAGIPGLSRTLEPRVNLWGEPMRGPGAQALINPATVRAESHTPIDDEIRRGNFNIAMPNRVQRFGPKGAEVPVDLADHPHDYTRLMQLSGNEMKGPYTNNAGEPLGLKDLLNDIVSGKNDLSEVYNMKKDAGKEVMLRDLISKYQQRARDKIAGVGEFDGDAEDPALAQLVQQKGEAIRALKIPQ